MDYNGTNENDVINQAALAIPDWTNIYGGEGNDVITIGNARAIGGAGSDTITGSTTSYSQLAYWSSPAGVVVNLQTGKAQDGYGTVDTLKNIQELQGTSFDDQLTGSTANENFWGGRGSNTIVGGGGFDTANYHGQKSTDATITYNPATDTFTVVKNFTDGDRGTDTLIGVSKISFGGSGSDNVSLSRKNLVAEGGFLRAIDVSSAVFPSGAWPTQFKTGDFNGDGRADYLIATQNGLGTVLSPMYVFLGDGAGGFADGTSIVFSTPPMNIVGGGRTLVADFNRDGISDVLQLDFGLDAPPYPGGLNSLYLSSNDSKKLADVSATLVQQTALNHALSSGDVNGDGLIDVLVNTLNHATDLGNQLYLNDGTGHFVLRQDLIPPPKTLTNTSSGIVDINGDGAPDLILGRHDGSNSAPASQILLNDGTGRFTKFAPIPLPVSIIPLEAILDVKGIDLNGDGLTDLMLSITKGGGSATSNDGTTYYKTAYIQLLVSQGNGKFTDETAARLPASVQDAFAKGWFVALAAVDIDRDGHTDIVATASGGGASVVLMNRGDGTFFQSWSSETGGSTIAADVNGDGMLDLLTNVGSSTYVEINKLPNKHIYKAAIDGNKLIGSSGSDTLIGSGGIDTAVYSGVRSNYTVIKSTDGYSVAAKTTGGGTDTLIGVERLKFADVSLAMDVSGNAGTVTKIIGSVFGAGVLKSRPDYVGVGLTYLDSGMTYEALAALAIRAAGATTPQQIVSLLWKNVVGTPATAAETQPFIDMLNNGMSVGALGVLASGTDLNKLNINLVGLGATGIDYV